MAQDNSQQQVLFPGIVVSGTATLDTRDVPYFDGVSIQASGAFSGTVLAEVSNDNGVTWSAISIRDEGSTTPATRIAAATGITGAGVYYVRLPFASFRLRCSAYVSGSPVFSLLYLLNDISA